MSSRRPLLVGVALTAVFASPLLVLAKRGSGGPPVEVSQATRRTISSTVLASGTFLYVDQIKISPEVLGVVERVLVAEGQDVSAGTPLLLIKADTYESDVAQRRAAVASQRAAVAQDEAQLLNSERKLARLERLSADGFATRSDLDDARATVAAGRAAISATRANVEQSAALLRLSEQNRNKTLIRSPRAGRVVEIATRSGETAVPSSVNLLGSSLLTIADTSRLVAEINVDEADAGRIKPSQRVDLVATAFPDQNIPGSVISVALSPGRRDTHELGLSEAASSQARTFSVRVSVPARYSAAIRAGMTCRAEIHWHDATAGVSVPVEAVRADDREKGQQNEPPFVYTLEDGAVRRRPVVLGDADDRFQAIVSGLRAGELVIVGPARTLANLSDGQRAKSMRLRK